MYLTYATHRSWQCTLFYYHTKANTAIYTLSLHDALPISAAPPPLARPRAPARCCRRRPAALARIDRKSTRLNSSHLVISYAVFCLKKKISKTVFIQLDSQTKDLRYHLNAMVKYEHIYRTT